MLTVRERQGVLKWFRHFCAVDLFPVQVNIQGWKVQPGSSTKTRAWASKTWYALFVAHCLYKVLNLLYTLLYFRGITLYELVIQGVLAGGGAGIVLWYYILYVRFGDENAALVRMTLTGAITGGITKNVLQ